MYICTCSWSASSRCRPHCSPRRSELRQCGGARKWPAASVPGLVGLARRVSSVCIALPCWIELGAQLRPQPRVVPGGNEIPRSGPPDHAPPAGSPSYLGPACLPTLYVYPVAWARRYLASARGAATLQPTAGPPAAPLAAVRYKAMLWLSDWPKPVHRAVVSSLGPCSRCCGCHHPTP